MNKVGDETNEIVDTIPGKTSDPSNLDEVLYDLRRYTVIETKNCDSFGGPKNVFYVSPNLSSDTIFTNQHIAATVECEDFSKHGYRLDTIQYFLCGFGMKPHMHLVENAIVSPYVMYCHKIIIRTFSKIAKINFIIGHWS